MVEMATRYSLNLLYGIQPLIITIQKKPMNYVQQCTYSPFIIMYSGCTCECDLCALLILTLATGPPPFGYRQVSRALVGVSHRFRANLLV